jgi:hypothetical protein
LRLLAATTDPERVLVLNDPFDSISGQWRERAADLLATFARTRKALIVIPALSYRPESWIDNQSVERIEVGQTAQRTIGFGAAGSQNNALINEIRDRVRQEQPQEARTNEKATLAGAAFGGAALETEDLIEPAPRRRWAPTSKIAVATIGAGLSVWVAISTIPASKLPSGGASNNATSTTQSPSTRPQSTNDSNENDASQVARKADNEGSTTNTISVAANVPPPQQPNQQKQPGDDFVLDRYPQIVKASLLDTARGIMNFKSTTGESAPAAQTQNDRSGNLFSLLESASSKSPNAPASAEDAEPVSSYNEAEEPIEAESEPVSASEEEARREEIRGRFLAAIQAAAARRQSETDIDEP